MSEGQDHTTREDLADRLLGHRGVLVARIRRYLARSGASAQQADDIFSTTVRRTDMLAAAGKLVDGLSDDSLLALASAIARNAAREAGRGAQRDQFASEVAEGNHKARATGTADSADAALAQELVARLDPKDLEVIGLRLRDLDWPAIAELTGSTVAAAHRRYYRALKAVAGIAQERA
jgi:DNA-directed RNA polymerase specialized sigma24 family protein